MTENVEKSQNDESTVLCVCDWDCVIV